MVGRLLSQILRAEKPKPIAWPSGLVGLGISVGGGCFFVAGAADVLGVFAGLAAVNSLPHPAGGLGDAPLELAGGFADEEW